MGLLRYQASAVIINLDTNDLGRRVSNARFQSAYISFLRNVRAKYPNAAIFVMETFKQWYVAQTKASVAARNSAGDAKVYTDPQPTQREKPRASVMHTRRLLGAPGDASGRPTRVRYGA